MANPQGTIQGAVAPNCINQWDIFSSVTYKEHYYESGISSFIYIVSLITIISCSSKQTDVDYPASSPLIKDLQDLNATIQSEFSVHTKASAKAIAAVAIADINGAYGGAKGGAKVGAYIGSL